VACPQTLDERPALSYRRRFLKSFLVLGVLFLVPRPACLELHLPAPEKLAHSVGMRVLDAAFAQEPMSLPDRCYLFLLHGHWSSSKASSVTNSWRPRSSTLLLSSASKPPRPYLANHLWHWRQL
jgi:hypothetical protein